MVTGCETGVVSEMPVASLSATTAVCGVSVLLLTTAASSMTSPSTTKRGVTGRINSGLVATTSTVPSPTCVLASTPTARNTQVVRLSGSLMLTLALPAASVVIAGYQKAVSAKFSRICG